MNGVQNVDWTHTKSLHEAHQIHFDMHSIWAKYTQICCIFFFISTLTLSGLVYQLAVYVHSISFVALYWTIAICVRNEWFYSMNRNFCWESIVRMHISSFSISHYLSIGLFLPRCFADAAHLLIWLLVFIMCKMWMHCVAFIALRFNFHVQL